MFALILSEGLAELTEENQIKFYDAILSSKPDLPI